MATQEEQDLKFEFEALEAEYEQARLAHYDDRVEMGKSNPDLAARRDAVGQRLADMRMYWRQIGEAMPAGAPGWRAGRTGAVSVTNNDGSVAAGEG